MWKTSLLPEALTRGFAPRTAATVTRWSAKNVFLTPKQSPGNPGYYNPDLCPYLHDFMDGFTDPSFDEDHVIKSSQCMVTEAFLNICRYAVAEEPQNILYAIDSREEAKKIANIRLIPTLRGNASTARAISEDKDDITSLTVNLREMVIYLLGSYSKAGFENKAVSLIGLDELAKHKVEKGQPSTVDLARERFKTLKGQKRKLYTMTKPSTEDSVEWREYLTGTREHWMMPCPHCAHLQALVWENVKYEHCRDLAKFYDLEAVAADTYYQCSNEKCEDRSITQAEIRAMIPRGRWVRTNFDRDKHACQPRKRSRHISDLISPFCTLGDLAVEFIGCGDDEAKLTSFRISRLGLPKKVLQQIDLEEADILRLRGAYLRGTFPTAPSLVCLTVDVQKAVQKYVISGFIPRPGGRGIFDLYVADWGDTSDISEQREFVSGTRLRCVDTGEFVQPMIALMDEGYESDDVREFVRGADDTLPYGWYPSRGRGGWQVRGIVWKVDVKHEDTTVPAYFYADDAIKRKLYRSHIGRTSQYLARLQRDPADEVARERLARSPRIWFPKDVTEGYYRELLSERLVTETDTNGFKTEKWEKDDNVPNDFGDGTKLPFVIWHVVGSDFASGAAAEASATPGMSARVHGAPAEEAKAA